MGIVLCCVGLFWVGYYVGRRRVNVNISNTEVKRVRASFKSPIVPYSVDY